VQRKSELSPARPYLAGPQGRRQPSRVSRPERRASRRSDGRLIDVINRATELAASPAEHYPAATPRRVSQDQRQVSRVVAAVVDHSRLLLSARSNNEIGCQFARIDSGRHLASGARRRPATSTACRPPRQKNEAASRAAAITPERRLRRCSFISFRPFRRRFRAVKQRSCRAAGSPVRPSAGLFADDNFQAPPVSARRPKRARPLNKFCILARPLCGPVPPARRRARPTARRGVRLAHSLSALASRRGRK
jgi:hypothetical protein